METSVNNNNIESKNGVNNTLPTWCKNGLHVLFEGRLHVIECAPKKEYEHLHEVIIEDCETHHCHFENWDNLTPCTPDGRDLLPEPPTEVHIDVEPTLETVSEIKDDSFFTKGKKYRCIKSVVMKNGGKTFFKAGSIYEQTNEPTHWVGWLRNEQGDRHTWPQPVYIADEAKTWGIKPEDLDPRLYFEPVSE